MPLDTSTYSLALLRLDGRRWNELRRLHAQVSTQAAADGSSYLEMGNTKVICTVTGPADGRRAGGGGGGGGGGGNEADVRVEIGMAGFSGVDRKKRSRGDKRISEMQSTLANAFSSSLFTHLYPHSIITITLNVLSQDGSVLAACVNAATLALIDAGIPMSDYIIACTAGLTLSSGSNNDETDPLLDLNGLEEQELPFLTVGTLGATEQISILVMESRVPSGRIESMLAVGVDGCKQLRQIMDRVVRAHGKKILGSIVA